jgi:hypothetical protein
MSLAMYRETQADLWYEAPDLIEETAAVVRNIAIALIRRNGNGIHPKVDAAIESGDA